MAYQKQLFKKKSKAVPVGFKHAWKYKTEQWFEQKIKPKTWTFTYYQTKGRKYYKAKPGQGMPIGDTIIWGIKAIQTAKKTGANTYKLIMKGTKKQIGYIPKTKKKWKQWR